MPTIFDKNPEHLAQARARAVADRERRRQSRHIDDPSRASSSEAGSVVSDDVSVYSRETSRRRDLNRQRQQKSHGLSDDLDLRRGHGDDASLESTASYNGIMSDVRCRSSTRRSEVDKHVYDERAGLQQVLSTEQAPIVRPIEAIQEKKVKMTLISQTQETPNNAVNDMLDMALEASSEAVSILSFLASVFASIPGARCLARYSLSIILAIVFIILILSLIITYPMSIIRPYYCAMATSLSYGLTPPGCTVSVSAESTRGSRSVKFEPPRDSLDRYEPRVPNKFEFLQANREDVKGRIRALGESCGQELMEFAEDAQRKYEEAVEWGTENEKKFQALINMEWMIIDNYITSFPHTLPESTSSSWTSWLFKDTSIHDKTIHQATRLYNIFITAKANFANFSSTIPRDKSQGVWNNLVASSPTQIKAAVKNARAMLGDAEAWQELDDSVTVWEASSATMSDLLDERRKMLDDHRTWLAKKTAEWEGRIQGVERGWEVERFEELMRDCLSAAVEWRMDLKKYFTKTLGAD